MDAKILFLLILLAFVTDGLRHDGCNRKVYVDRLVDEEKTHVVSVPVYFCCPGSKLLNDNCISQADLPNHWTTSTTGCPCYFNLNQDCACCVYGGCQCGYQFPDRCVECGYGHLCHPIFDAQNRRGIDAWTSSETGCACDGSDKPGNCPCCQNQGCQCKTGNTKRCKQCGLPQSCYKD